MGGEIVAIKIAWNIHPKDCDSHSSLVNKIERFFLTIVYGLGALLKSGYCSQGKYTN